MSARSHDGMSATRRRQPAGPRLPYLPGLDGLRGFAILAVVFYHAGLPWMPGGFLGVEIFFVISGYLITSLLLAEWRERGRVDFRAFWLRRARRLLPALFLLLASVLAFAVVFLPAEVAGLRSDAAAAVGYATNWYLIFSQKSYFETVGRPSLLRHLWSLAVEEQFYLLWPLLFAGAARVFRGRHLVWVIAAAAAASVTLMALLYRPDVDPSRVYYGSDTRAAALLIGAGLALVWLPGKPPRWAGRGQGWPANLLGLLALGGLAAFCVRMDEFTPFLYRGGFVAVALASALAIACAVHPTARVIAALLGWGPLRWIGLRCYGIYLWHWPVFMVTRPQLDVALDGVWLLAARLAITALIAEFSYRCVEMPIRTGALGRAWNALRDAHGARRAWLGMRWAAAAAVVALFFVALGGPVVSAQPQPQPAYLAVTEVHVTSPAVSLTPVAPAAPASVVHAPAVYISYAAVAAAAAGEPAANTQPTHTATSPPSEPVSTPAPVRMAAATSMPSAAQAVSSTIPLAAPPPAGREAEAGADFLPSRRRVNPAAYLKTPLKPDKITAIGDSVMVGAANELTGTIASLDLDAALGRQAPAAIELLRTRRAAGELGTVVILHLGSNGAFSGRQLDDVMAVLWDARRVVMVNVKAPRQWETPNNTVLSAGVKRYPQITLVDWRGATEDQPDLFWEDGIHLRPEGRRLYVELIAAALAKP